MTWAGMLDMESLLSVVHLLIKMLSSCFFAMFRVSRVRIRFSFNIFLVQLGLVEMNMVN